MDQELLHHNESTSNWTSTEDFEPIQMTLAWRVVWDLLFGVSMFLSILGNTSIIWMIMVDKTTWSVPNFFICNMCASDFMMTTLNCITNYIYMRDQAWYFSDMACTFNNFLAVLTISASVLNLTAMSTTRYYAIVFPLKPKLRRYQVIIILATAWLISIGLAMPNIFYSKALYIEEVGVKICILDWSLEYEGIFNITLTTFTYLLPLIIIFSTTVHMSHVLWCRPPVGELNEQLEISIIKKKKIVKLLWMLFTVFAISWLPYHLYFILIMYFPDIKGWMHIQNLFLTFYWLAMSHAMVNPAVYFAMKKTLRQRLFRRLGNLLRRCRSQSTSSDRRFLTSSMRPEMEGPLAGLAKPLPPLAVIPLEFSPKHEGKKIACLANFNYEHEAENPLTDKEILESEKINNNVDNISTITAAGKMKKRRCQRILSRNGKEAETEMFIKNASDMKQAQSSRLNSLTTPGVTTSTTKKKSIFNGTQRKLSAFYSRDKKTSSDKNLANTCTNPIRIQKCTTV